MPNGTNIIHVLSHKDCCLFVQIGAKTTISCSLGTNCIFIPGLCANRGDNCDPAIETGQSTEQMLSPGTTDLETVFSRGFCTIVLHLFV